MSVEQVHLGRARGARARSWRRSRQWRELLRLRGLDAVLADRAGERADPRRAPRRRARLARRGAGGRGRDRLGVLDRRDAARARRAALGARRRRRAGGPARTRSRRPRRQQRVPSFQLRASASLEAASARADDRGRAATRRDPRRRDGRPHGRVGAQPPELRDVRGHGLPARLAPRRQGREQPRRPRAHRGARAARLARLLRQRVPAHARGLRRARPPAHRPRLPDRRLARRVHRPRQRRRRGPLPTTLVALGRDVRPATTTSRALPSPATARCSAATFFERGLRLLADFSRSLREERTAAPAGVVLSASPEPAAIAGAGRLRGRCRARPRSRR